MTGRGQPADRNHVLDGLRGVAAIMVLAFHVGALTGIQRVDRGYLAVDLFFVLSGFVIARSYDGRFVDGMDSRSFMLRRVVRLYPVYAAGIALGIARIFGMMREIGEPMTVRVAAAAALNAAMLPAPLGNPTLYPFNIPAWSLFFEVIVNLVYALWLVRLSSATLAMVAGTGAVAMIAGAVTHGTIDLGAIWSTAPFGLARVMFAFPAGMLIARLPVRQAASSWRTGLVLAVTALLLWLPKAWLPSPGFDLAFALLFAPMLVAAAARLAAPPAMTGSLGVLGDLSYPLYSIHFPLAALLLGGLVAGGWSVLAAGWAAMATPIIAAAGVARWYDRPIRRWLSARVASGGA